MTLRSEKTLKISGEVSRTLRLGLPLVAAQVTQMSMGFVDTIMAGNLNARALAAVAVGNSLLTPLLVFGFGVLMAINPIVAHLFGARKNHRIGQKLWQVLWLSQLLALPVFFLVRNTDFVMEFFQVQPEIVPVTREYLLAFSWGFPAAFGYYAMRYFNEGISVTKPSMYFALIGLAVNVVGNYVFMYGHLGFPAMGAVGTGWASALVLWVMLAGMALFTFHKKRTAPFCVWQGFRLPRRRALAEILKVGLPNGISVGIEVSMFAAAALIIGSMGVNAVAAHQVTINFAAMTFMIPLGLSFATTARVGFAIGQKQMPDARFIGFVGIALSVAVMCFTALFMITVPEFIIGIYTQDGNVKEVAVRLLFLAGIFQISDGLQVSGLGALRGLKDTRVPMMVNIVAYWLVGLPSGYFLGVRYAHGPDGLWIGLILGLSVAAVLHTARFHYLTKRVVSADAALDCEQAG